VIPDSPQFCEISPADFSPRFFVAPKGRAGHFLRFMASFQTLPGFREFYPDAFAQRAHIFRLWRQAAHAHGFAEYDAPVLEPLDLYRAKSGDEIEAQLFNFVDKGGREVALRPEMTPTVCRLVGEKANALKRPSSGSALRSSTGMNACKKDAGDALRSSMRTSLQSPASKRKPS
jgi:hypothetical protein